MSPEPTPSLPEELAAALKVEAFCLELGGALAPLVTRDGGLPARVGAVRRDVAAQLGFPFPTLRIVDNLQLPPQEYRLLARGQELARGWLQADRIMVLDPSGAPPAVEGTPATDPSFGMAVKWLPAAERTRVEAAGYVAVDALSVLATHLGEVVHRHAHELLGVEGTAALLELCGKDHPRLAAEVVPARASVGELAWVLRALLREGIPVRDLVSILEVRAEVPPAALPAHAWVERARARLARQVTACVAVDGGVRCLTLDKALERSLLDATDTSGDLPALRPPLEVAEALLSRLERGVALLDAEARPRVLLAPGELRAPLSAFVARRVARLFVVCPAELTAGTRVEPVEPHPA